MTAADRCATTVLVDTPVASVWALLEVERLLTTAGTQPSDASMPAEAPEPREEARHAADSSASSVGADVGRGMAFTGTSCPNPLWPSFMCCFESCCATL